MKNLIVVLVMVCTALSVAQPENSHWYGQELELGKNYYTYANDLTLRDAPSKNGAKIALLPINTPVKLLAISKETILVNRLESAWVKVIASGKEGYLASGLLALNRLKLADGSYLLYTREGTQEVYNQRILFRIANGTSYKELGTYNLYNTSFSVEVYGNKGLTGINHIIEVGYLAEACGEQGGMSYFTLDLLTSRFTNLGIYSSIGDSGVFHLSEELIFPSDENGSENTITYTGEQGQYEDDEETTYRTVQKTKTYTWQNGQLEKPIVKFKYQ